MHAGAEYEQQQARTIHPIREENLNEDTQQRKNFCLLSSIFSPLPSTTIESHLSNYAHTYIYIHMHTDIYTKLQPPFPLTSPPSPKSPPTLPLRAFTPNLQRPEIRMRMRRRADRFNLLLEGLRYAVTIWFTSIFLG